jgi:hypothetical protein
LIHTVFSSAGLPYNQTNLSLRQYVKGLPVYTTARSSARMPINGSNREQYSLLQGQQALNVYSAETEYLDGQYMLALHISISLASSLGFASSESQSIVIPLSFGSGIGVHQAVTAISEIPVYLPTSIGVVDSQSVQLEIGIRLMDRLVFADVIRSSSFGNMGYVMNANTNAVSTYMGWSMTSMAKIGQRFYATTPAGLAVLEGDTDDGVQINAIIRTRKDDADESYMKRVLKAYMGISAAGTVYLKTIAGNDEVRVYAAPVNSTILREKKVDLGRGVKSRYWQFELVNIAGGDFTLESIEFFPVVLSRHF